MKSIDGAPETITHAQVIAACEALGLDPIWVRSIKIGLGNVEVVLHAFQPAKIRQDKDDCAEHTVYYDIPDEPLGR